MNFIMHIIYTRVNTLCFFLSSSSGPSLRFFSCHLLSPPEHHSFRLQTKLLLRPLAEGVGLDAQELGRRFPVAVGLTYGRGEVGLFQFVETLGQVHAAGGGLPRTALATSITLRW